MEASRGEYSTRAVKVSYRKPREWSLGVLCVQRSWTGATVWRLITVTRNAPKLWQRRGQSAYLHYGLAARIHSLASTPAGEAECSCLHISSTWSHAQASCMAGSACLHGLAGRSTLQFGVFLAGYVRLHPVCVGPVALGGWSLSHLVALQVPGRFSPYAPARDTT